MTSRTQKFLTTGQIAGHCGVSFRTVLRWIQKGLLKAQRLPGRGDHRIEISDFVEFLENNKMRVPSEIVHLASQPSPETGISIEGSDPASPKQMPATLPPWRALVVDDEPFVAQALKRILSKMGFEVAIALNGFDAGMKFVSWQPQLVTLDLRMPGLKGLDVLQQLRSDLAPVAPEHRPRIMVISGDSDSELEKAAGKGADAVISKPFDVKTIEYTIHQFPEFSHLHSQLSGEAV